MCRGPLLLALPEGTPVVSECVRAETIRFAGSDPCPACGHRTDSHTRQGRCDTCAVVRAVSGDSATMFTSLIERGYLRRAVICGDAGGNAAWAIYDDSGDETDDELSSFTALWYVPDEEQDDEA
jgi:hypothetical protein